MKLKIEFNTKNIFVCLYILLIVANITATIAMYRYINHYIYKTLTIDRSSLVSGRNILTGDIDMEKFEKIYNNLENKTKGNILEGIKNIF